jgi:hypothetical protein
MPFRLHNEGFPDRTKIQFTTSLAMPHLIYRACKETGVVSNTVYVQHAVAYALARDLNIPVEKILADLPIPRGPAAHLYDPADGTMDRYGSHYRSVVVDPTGGFTRIGPANTNEDVR